jgi:hypothetical protein
MPAIDRPRLLRRWTNCRSAGRIFIPPRAIYSTRALAEVGRIEEALEEFHAVVAYFPGAEAKVRYALLLKLVGRTAEAKVIFAELMIQMKRAPKYLREAQDEWLSIAEKQLSA